MKRISLNVAFVSAVIAFAGYNVYSTQKSKKCDLTLIEVEALADTEWNSVTDWFDQGLTKDEREEKRECTTSSSISGSVTGIVAGTVVSGEIKYETTNTTWEIICPEGDENCTEVDC